MDFSDCHKKNLNHINGVIGIASAPDFIVEQWDKLSKNEQLEFKKTGSMFFPDPDHGDYEVSYKFVEDGFNNLLLNDEINIKCPIRLLHGKQDKVVPVNTSQRIIKKILSEDKDLIVIDDGDHSLSSKKNLKIINRELSKIVTNII